MLRNALPLDAPDFSRRIPFFTDTAGGRTQARSFFHAP